MKYKCIKNFLKQDEFESLKSIIDDNTFPWFYRDKQTHYDNDDRFFFYHIFYIDGKENSPYFNLLDVILKKLKVKKLISARMNLITKDTNKQHVSNLHVDYTIKNCKTAIYYMNTNNGFTYLKADKNIKVLCEENKIFIFDSRIEHASVSQTDENKRIVINFNYI